MRSLNSVGRGDVAYGWSDIAVVPFCPATADDRAAVARFEDAVIDRLFARPRGLE